MRGKKKDPDFLSQFIVDCVSNNKSSSEEIVLEAKTRIKNIDSKIMEINNLKLQRSKLLDVIESFDSPKSKSLDEIKILPFFKISNVSYCKKICDKLKVDTLSIENLDQDMIFCIKQLLELNIISKSGNTLSKGIMFDEYVKFVLLGD